MKHLKITVNGKDFDVTVQEVDGGSLPVPQISYAPAMSQPPIPFAGKDSLGPAVMASGPVTVLAPMPGNIHEIKAEEGQSVSRGEVILLLEALKMETEIVAPADGEIVEFHVKKGDTVDSGALLVSMK
jgi:biotin carboxyl carrier protein